MTNKTEIENFARFLDDVKTHAVTILHDDGVYRHLRCSSGGSYCYSFNLVTWPGHLAYSGDMGSFTFARLPDMFEFFRGHETALVDFGYIAEKCVAADKHDVLRLFSEELFTKIITERFNEYAETENIEGAERDELWEDVETSVIGAAADGQQQALTQAMEFRHGKREVFPDIWEHRFEEYTGRFWWCCYAIPWAIARYDAIKNEQAKAPSDIQQKIATSIIPVVEATPIADSQTEAEPNR